MKQITNIKKLYSTARINLASIQKYNQENLVQAPQSQFLQQQQIEYIKQKRSQLNLDSLLGPSSRKTYFRHFEKTSSDGVFYFYEMHAQKGLGLKPTGKWTAEEFEKKMQQLFPQMIDIFYKIEEAAFQTIISNVESDLQNILKNHHNKVNPGKEFVFEQEFAKMMELDDKTFEKEFIHNKK